MPFHEWEAGEEILSDDFNSLVARQVVCRFSDAAQRATQLPAPTLNQLSALDSYPGAIFIWNGTGWTEPSPYAQAGYTELTTNGSGGGVIVFPKAFAGPPLTVSFTDMGASDFGGTGIDYVTVGAIYGQVHADEVGFVARVAKTGAYYASGFLRLGWVAHGVRATGA